MHHNGRLPAFSNRALFNGTDARGLKQKPTPYFSDPSTEPRLTAAMLLSDFSGGIDELVYSVYLSSELIVTDTQTVDGPGVL